MKRILALLAVTVACASTQTAADVQLNAAPAAQVVVKNFAPVEATVYLVDRGSSTRLGTVTAMGQARFPVRTFGSTAAFYVAPRGAKRGFTTNAVQNVRAGDSLLLRIEPNVTLSYLSR